MTAFAGAFSTSTLFHQTHATDWLAASRAVGHLDAAEVAQNEDYWTVIQRGYSVDSQIMNLNNGGVSPAPIVVQQAVERFNQMTNEGPYSSTATRFTPSASTTKTFTASASHRMSIQNCGPG